MARDSKGRFISGSVTDTDKGLAAFAERAAKARGTVTVGVHAEDAGGTYPDGITVGEIATIHEYGTSKIPERSFIRAWADQNKEKNAAAVKAVAEQVIKGRFGPSQALDRLGLLFVGSIQARMAQGIPPALADSTLAHRPHGGSVPLIDTGQLKSAIRHKVEDAGK